MSRRIFPLLLVFAIALPVALQAESTDFLPAGTLLTSTIDEPNFWAKTAEIGDPLLCYLGMTASSRHTLLPRGASLGGPRRFKLTNLAIGEEAGSLPPSSHTCGE